MAHLKGLFCQVMFSVSAASSVLVSKYFCVNFLSNRVTTCVPGAGGSFLPACYDEEPLNIWIVMIVCSKKYRWHDGPRRAGPGHDGGPVRHDHDQQLLCVSS